MDNHPPLYVKHMIIVNRGGKSIASDGISHGKLLKPSTETGKSIPEQKTR
jgi:hypothetical protein